MIFYRKMIIPAFILNLFFCACSQTTGFSKTDAGSDTTGFEKLIFHATRCNGSCPKIDLKIDKNGTIAVQRELYKTKSEMDSSQSGQFKGILSKDQLNELSLLLQGTDTLEFTDMDITDVPAITMVIYKNGQRIYLKSKTPPPAAHALIDYLRRLGTTTTYAKTTDPLSFEN